MDFLVETSARHIHLTEAAIEALYGPGATLGVKKMLSQPGQFACTNEKIKLCGPKGELMVSVLGPARKACQVELSFTDARALGLKGVPVRESGDVAGTPGIKLVGPAGEVVLDKGVIVAERHIHMGPNTAAANGLKEGDRVLMCVESEGRTTIFGDTAIHTNGPDNGGALSHIDTDEGNACGCGKAATAYIIGKMEDLPRLFPDT